MWQTPHALQPDEHLAGPRLGELDLLHDERLAELLQHRRSDPHRRASVPCPPLNVSDVTPNADIVAEAGRLLEAAAEADVPVRLVGGLAVRAHLPAGAAPVISRDYKDIDLVTLKGKSRAVTAFMTDQGYEADRVFNTTNGHRRLLYYDVPHQRQVDVFVGAFEMCHSIPITERIDLHPTAVPLAELLLTKMQIVELNAKDQSDIITMLYHHDVGDGDDGIINAKRVAQLCAADWGLWRTTKMNVERTREALAAGGFGPDVSSVVEPRLRAAVGGHRGRPEVGPLEDAKPRGRQGALVRGARRGRMTRAKRGQTPFGAYRRWKMMGRWRAQCTRGVWRSVVRGCFARWCWVGNSNAWARDRLRARGTARGCSLRVRTRRSRSRSRAQYREAGA